MSDTTRTRAYLLAVFPDNIDRLIDPRDARDLIVSAFPFLANVDPALDNDRIDSAGMGAYFDFGSRWLNLATGGYWVCTDGQPTNAQWTLVNSGVVPNAITVDAVDGSVTIPDCTQIKIDTDAGLTLVDLGGGVAKLSAYALGVTSVGLSLPASLFAVSGSPVTGAGTLVGTLQPQTLGTAFMGPVSGSPAAPVFRTIQVSDLPAGYPFANLSGVPTAYVAYTLQQQTGPLGTPTPTLYLLNLDTLAGPLFIEFDNLTGAGLADLVMQVSYDGVTYATGAADYSYATTAYSDNNTTATRNSTGSNQLRLSATYTVLNGTVKWSNDKINVQFSAALSTWLTTPLTRTVQGAGRCELDNGAAITLPIKAIKFTNSDGSNFTDGTIRLYAQQPITNAGASGVTSVGVTVPPWLTVTGTPITSAGVIAIAGNAATPAGYVIAAPAAAAGAPIARPLVPTDLGSGTPDNTVFLRGDGVWTTPPYVSSVVVGTSPVQVVFNGVNTYTVSLLTVPVSLMAVGYPASNLGSGTVPAGVSVPAARVGSGYPASSLGSGTIPVGVSVPASRVGSGYPAGYLSSGTLPAGVICPAAQVSAGYPVANLGGGTMPASVLVPPNRVGDGYGAARLGPGTVPSGVAVPAANVGSGYSPAILGAGTLAAGVAVPANQVGVGYNANKIGPGVLGSAAIVPASQVTSGYPYSLLSGVPANTGLVHDVFVGTVPDVGPWHVLNTLNYPNGAIGRIWIRGTSGLQVAVRVTATDPFGVQTVWQLTSQGGGQVGTVDLNDDVFVGLAGPFVTIKYEVASFSNPGVGYRIDVTSNRT